ncbi:SDR family NAD(P)-dependent oxidoreductase [Amycolatopsis sp. cmx-4-68]|uniref:SDR family NAD(P)-dependent oxidoreductase n=1 Tax=Amycolatopsis sp. cmx-4-68 TaxID=2790938 RepID=UPI00397A8398
MTDVRRALVVGGSRGFGARLVNRLSENGWAVTATGRRPRSDTSLVDRVDYEQIDLAADTAVRDLLEFLRSLRPRLVVFNAAAYPTAEPDLAECEVVFRVNALVPHHVFADYLPGAECTCVLINSDSIYHANRTSGVYAASKAALRVLTSALADRCRGSRACAATLLLGPLADERKAKQFERIAQQRQMTPEEVEKAFLRRANPSYVVDSLIDLEACVRTVEYLVDLGTQANGMLCRLDGGSAGSLL